MKITPDERIVGTRLRADLAVDGEPIGAVEIFRVEKPHRSRRPEHVTRIRLGDTEGRMHEYTPGRGGGRSTVRDVGPAGFNDFLASALAKSWWLDRCPGCRSRDRDARELRFTWGGGGDRKIPCDSTWHEYALVRKD